MKRAEPELPPCPQVNPGDAGSWLDRARWRRAHGRRDTEALLFDIDQVMRLAPGHPEPWHMLARLEEDSLQTRLNCLNEAVLRGGGVEPLREQLSILWEWGHWPEVLDCTSALLHLQPNHGPARHKRALVRAHLGDLPGAIADLEEIQHASGEWRCALAICLWCAGRFEAAFERAVGAGRFSNDERQLSVWRHLCRVGVGMQAPMPIDPCAPERVDAPGSWRLREDSPWVDWHHNANPAHPPVDAWRLLEALYQGRVSLSEFHQACAGAIQRTIQLQASVDPERMTPHDAFAWAPERHISAQQVHFYAAMWQLQSGDTAGALASLDAASSPGDPCISLEHLAARAHRERLRSGTWRPPANAWQAFIAPARDPALTAEHARIIDVQIGKQSRSSATSELMLRGWELDDEDIAHWVARGLPRSVQRINLSNNHISWQGLAQLIHSDDVRSITSLNLSGNPIGNRGVRMLFEGGNFSALQVLDITSTQATEAAFESLVHQTHMPHLQVIHAPTSLDMPLWIRLAERYGHGLRAAGEFKSPYAFGGPPQQRVRVRVPVFWPFPGPPPGTEADTADATERHFQAVFTVSMVSFLRAKWLRLARWDGDDTGPVPLQAMRDLERQCLQRQGDTLELQDKDFRWMLKDPGIELMDMRCSACEHMREMYAHLPPPPPSWQRPDRCIDCRLARPDRCAIWRSESSEAFILRAGSSR